MLIDAYWRGLNQAPVDGPGNDPISVLEVGDDTPDETIEQLDRDWKNNLLSRKFGLNHNWPNRRPGSSLMCPDVG